ICSSRPSWWEAARRGSPPALAYGWRSCRSAASATVWCTSTTAPADHGARPCIRALRGRSLTGIGSREEVEHHRGLTLDRSAIPAVPLVRVDEDLDLCVRCDEALQPLHVDHLVVG